MKYVRLTALLGVLPLLLLLLTGCQKEETLGNDDKAPGITLALTIPASASALTRATTVPLAGENTLSNVYVLFYPKGALNLAAPSYFYAETNISKEEDWTYDIPGADLRRNLTGGVEYDIYIVASLPTGTVAPTATTTKGELLALVETQFERSAAPLMSFSGKGEVTYIANNSITVDIPLYRTVARLDITIKGLKAGQTAELQLMQASTTPYFKEKRPTFTFQKDELKADASNIYRAYVYESYTSDDTSGKTQLIINVISSDGSDPVTFSPIIVNNGIIERNKIYAYNIDVDTPDPTIIGFFGGWDETEQEYTKQLQVDTETYITDPLLAWEPSATLTNAVNRHSGTANVDILKAINTDLANYPAAQHCEKKGNGWYLPSQAQLMAMWVISEGLPTKYKLASTTEPYWSSTEAGSSVSWTVSFADGRTIYLSKASVVYRVRCVRDVTP